MVAISLYRGNLHKPPDTPRKWVMPPHKLSLKDFKTLLHRRNKALRALQNSQTTLDPDAQTAGISEGNNGKSIEGFDGSVSGSADKGKQVKGSDGSVSGSGGKRKQVEGFDGSGSVSGSGGKGKQIEGFDGSVSGSDGKGFLGGPGVSEGLRVEVPGDSVAVGAGVESSMGLRDSVIVVERGSNGSGSLKGVGIEIPMDTEAVAVDKSGKGQGVEVPCDLAVMVVEKGSGESGSLKELKVEIPSERANTDAEKANKVEPSNEKDKKKRQIEEELKVLSERKHNLVQALKQILSAEEELKRRNSMQGSVARPPSQLKIEVPNDSGSMTHHTATKLGSETNNGGVAGGTEGHNTSSQNVHSRHLLRTNSVSPSSDSLRRPAFSQYNVVPHPSRASLGVLESPSRFAPTSTGQGHSTNLPAVSASGTNYIASSPSPAASGGTSVFRDSRFPSPWN